MNIFQLRDAVIERLTNNRDDFDYRFDREKEELRVERKDNQQGVTVNLNLSLIHI